MSTVVKAQYEAYPYPHRRPEDEAKRLIQGTPSALGEIEHYIFGGRLPEQLRVLSAGGGTGDAVIMIAQQAKDRGLPVEIVHLDLSTASQDVARRRAEARGLTSIRFVNGSLLSAPEHGHFDYIDCCGVLHHLDDPPAGLAALKTAMKPTGGMGIMVYAPLGRTGVYPLQAALRTLTAGLEAADKVALAKKLLAGLPATNWLKRNPLMNDHLVSDAGLYDLLLHSTDRAYSVPELVEFVTDAGLDIVEFIEPAKYDPATYIHDPSLLLRVPDDRHARAALAEELSGILHKHVVYLAPAAEALSREARNAPGMVPFYNNFDGQQLARSMTAGQPMIGTLNGLKVNLPMPRLAAAVMQRIDGQKNWSQIHADLAATLGREAPDWDRCWAQIEEIWQHLHSINVLLLRQPEAA